MGTVLTVTGTSVVLPWPSLTVTVNVSVRTRLSLLGV